MVVGAPRDPGTDDLDARAVADSQLSYGHVSCVLVASTHAFDEGEQDLVTPRHPKRDLDVLAHITLIDKIAGELLAYFQKSPEPGQ